MTAVQRNASELLIFGNPHKGFNNHKPGCKCPFCHHARKIAAADAKMPKAMRGVMRSSNSVNRFAVYKDNVLHLVKRSLREAGRAAIKGRESGHAAQVVGPRQFFNKKLNPSKVVQMKSARERAGKIRGARLNPGRTYEAAGKQFKTRAKAEKYAKAIEKSSGIRVPVYETTGANPKAFAGWKHFTKAEKNFLRSIHAPAPKNEDEVRAYKETLRKIDEINARKNNPTHMQVSFDRGIQKYLAVIYDPKFGNLYASGFTKKQAAKALHDRVREARRAGTHRNPNYFGVYSTREKGDRFLLESVETSRAAANAERKRLRAAGYRSDVKGPRSDKDFPVDPRPPRSNSTHRNPDETRQAVKLFQSFHGKDPKDITEKHVSAEIRKDYAALGDLEYLKVVTPLGQTVQFNFHHDGVKLASSPDGKQLYCIGGNQNLTSCLTPDSLEKDFIDLGEAIEVQYLARKIHSNFEPTSYYHKFGEKTGARPQLAYDKLKRQIFFVGGEYFIKADKGVSPGIEN